MSSGLAGQTADVQIRAYADDDLTALHAINESEVPNVGSVTLDAMRDLIGYSSIALVAEHDGRVVGFCLVIPPGTEYGSSNYAWFTERYHDFIYLDRIAVADAFHGCGVGRRCYAEVERIARELHPTATDLLLEVNVRPRNDASLAFHARLGFGEVARRESGGGLVVAMMSKTLTASG